MPNRRSFNIALLMSAAALALRPAPASASPADPDITLLNRLTFGATPQDRADLTVRGAAGWLDDQLSRPARDPAIRTRLANQKLRIQYDADDDGEGHAWPALDELRPLSSLEADPATLVRLVDWDQPMSYAERVRPADEVIAASLTRAVHAPAQLREVMTQFWHDHFNVHAQKNEFTAAFFASYDASLRDHAFGNFRDLLGAVARSPSMLVYLNNDESRASPANENWARELLELHTLGAGNYLNSTASRWSEVPGAADGRAVGYIDEDVFEVARAFTGWTVGDGRYVSDGVNAPKTGLFHYVEGWHDPYQKRVLGHEMAPNRAPLADGDEVLDILASHPGTARFICEKIARRLLTDTPDTGLVDRLAQVFLAQAAAPDQIAQVIRALVADPAFAAPPTKIRRPFEFLAALYRASGVKVAAPEAAFHWQLGRAGWLQHTFPPPTGHPDTVGHWSSGTVIIRLVDMAISAHDDWYGNTATRLSDLISPEVRTMGQLAAFWTDRTGHRDPLPGLMAALGASAADPLPADPGSRHDLSATVLAFAAISPQFLFR